MFVRMAFGGNAGSGSSHQQTAAPMTNDQNVIHKSVGMIILLRSCQRSGNKLAMTLAFI